MNAKHSGSYTCVARNSAAKVNHTAILMVKVAPQWIVEPRDVTTLLGNSVAVHCEASGYPIPKLTWLRGQTKSVSDFQLVVEGNSRINIATNGSIMIDNVLAEDEGHYLCRAVNGIGTGLSKIVFLGVNGKFQNPFSDHI